jgi:hypothetical protein
MELPQLERKPEVHAKISYGVLKKVIKEMSNQYSVKVGLLKGHGGDDLVSDNADLAYIGSIQEFGADLPVTDKMRGWFYHTFEVWLNADVLHIPARSWLVYPLEQWDKLKKNIMGGLKRWELQQYLEDTGDFRTLAEMVGAGALKTIQEAFDTSGWGTWTPNSPITTKHKGSSKPLIDTGNLRNHISYEIEEKK